MSRANIGILVDGVDIAKFGFFRRMVYNIIRMYSLSGTYINIMVYGSEVFQVVNFAQFRSADDLKKVCSSMPKVANGVRSTGNALKTMVHIYANLNLYFN